MLMVTFVPIPEVHILQILSALLSYVTGTLFTVNQQLTNEVVVSMFGYKK